MDTSRPYRVQRVQECLVDVENEEDRPENVAVEIATGMNEWETVDLSAEPA